MGTVRKPRARAEARETKESALARCPVLDGAAYREYRAAAEACAAYGEAAIRWYRGLSPEEQTGWHGTTAHAGRALLQPWNLETMFLLAVSGRARFNEIHRAYRDVGLSTRTLSNKLRGLVREGLVERVVDAEATPVRIEYRLTRLGTSIAALAAPLFTRLNLEALRRAGRR